MSLKRKEDKQDIEALTRPSTADAKYTFLRAVILIVTDLPITFLTSGFFKKNSDYMDFKGKGRFIQNCYYLIAFK